MTNTGIRNRQRPQYRIKNSNHYSSFVLFKCQLVTCCNFFTRDTYYGDPKYCHSHIDKHGNLGKQFKLLQKTMAI